MKRTYVLVGDDGSGFECLSPIDGDLQTKIDKYREVVEANGKMIIPAKGPRKAKEIQLTDICILDSRRPYKKKSFN